MYEKSFHSGESDRSSKSDFMSLFLANQRRIFAFILMFIPNRSNAEDLMQETASWMWENFDNYTPGTSFGAWGVQVARYKILNLNRSTSNKYLKFSGDLLDLIDAKAEKVLEKEDRRVNALRNCLSSLKKQDQWLIYLRYEKGLTTSKLAQVVQRPASGLYKTMARIHKMLLRCIRQKLIAEAD